MYDYKNSSPHRSLDELPSVNLQANYVHSMRSSDYNKGYTPIAKYKNPPQKSHQRLMGNTNTTFGMEPPIRQHLKTTLSSKRTSNGTIWISDNSGHGKMVSNAELRQQYGKIIG